MTADVKTDVAPAPTPAADAKPAPPVGPPPVGFVKLFHYADKWDILVLIIGLLCSLVNGVTMPAFSILFGSLLDKLNKPGGNFTGVIAEICLAFLVVGGIAFVASVGEMSLLNLSATRQIRRVRNVYYKALLRQDIGWFDVNTAGDLGARLAENTVQMYGGMGQKLGNTVHQLATLFFGFGVGFYYNWKLTLVIISFTPLMVMAGALLKVSGDRGEKRMKASYASAATVATNALTCIRTVLAFGGQEREVKNYTSHLYDAERAGKRKALYNGFTMGIMYGSIFFVYGVGLWYGAKLIRDGVAADPNCPANNYKGCFSGGDVMLVFFAVIMGAFSLGQVGPNMVAFATAQAAAARIFEIIDRTPVIDIASEAGERVQGDSIKGAISFRDVHFAYPSRPEQPILQGFSLDIAPGETVAFVGESGSGKSTLLQLLQRFYDPTSGTVEIDGKPLTSLHLKSLRSVLGIVAQEPALFGMSIRDNIALGALRDDVPEAEIHRAARLASATEFIDKLQDRYNTPVGERGIQLSGGQKQRIAIARAILKNPRVLMLDEATSALDTRSEREVQAALDNLVAKDQDGGSQRTTLVIAHRLSTVINVDRIVVMSKGQVVEMGSPAQLMAIEDGYFRRLLDMQNAMPHSVDALTDDAETSAVADAAPPEEAVGGQEAVALAADVPTQTPNPIAKVPSIQTSPSIQNTTSGGKSPVPVEDGAVSHPKEADPGEIVIKPVPMLRVWAFQKAEWHILTLGFIAAAVNGAIMPSFSLVFASMMNVFYTTDMEKLRKDSILLMGMFFLVGGVSMLAGFTQSWMFGMAGERLTTRIRSEVFRSIMKQDLTFFDCPSNASGALATRLSGDAALVQATTGPKLGVRLQGNFALLFALGIAFYSSWRLTLVVLGTTPFMLLSGVVMMKFMKGNDKDVSFVEAGSLSSESVTNIRLVASFNLQDKLQARFNTSLDKGISIAKRTHWMGGVVFGLSQFLIFGTYAVCFYAGSEFISHGWMTFLDMLRVFFALAMSATVAGQESQLAGDQNLANAAKESVFALIDRKSAIDPMDDSGLKPETCRGEIEFRNVSFAYPSRRHAPVLKNVSFVIPPGHMAAFVGASGCGKSTVVRLLLRFYDVNSGEILLDGVNIKELNVKWLREQFGLVSQEPDLFPDTLEYNILYGDPAASLEPTDTSRHPEPVTKSATEVPAAVADAAVAANAAGFIDGFSHKFGTRAGEMGSQLSGGQKQRVAIARAVIRRPHVLLLDEATSALDSESERIVQNALDNLVAGQFRGVTTLVIAHRLSTVRHASTIVVLHNGEVAEVGDHASLMRVEGGRYAKLIEAQEVSSSHTASPTRAAGSNLNTTAAHSVAPDVKTL